MNEIRMVTLSREDLQKVLYSFGTQTEYIHFSIEFDSIEGDQVLWVDNGEFDDNRRYIRVNKPHKNKENRA